MKSDGYKCVVTDEWLTFIAAGHPIFLPKFPPQTCEPVCGDPGTAIPRTFARNMEGLHLQRLRPFRRTLVAGAYSLIFVDTNS